MVLRNKSMGSIIIPILQMRKLEHREAYHYTYHRSHLSKKGAWNKCAPFEFQSTARVQRQCYHKERWHSPGTAGALEWGCHLLSGMAATASPFCLVSSPMKWDRRGIHPVGQVRMKGDCTGNALAQSLAHDKYVSSLSDTPTRYWLPWAWTLKEEGSKRR